MHASSTSADDRGGRWVAAQFVLMVNRARRRVRCRPAGPTRRSGLLAGARRGGLAPRRAPRRLGVAHARPLRDRVPAAARGRAADRGRAVRVPAAPDLQPRACSSSLGYALATSPAVFVPLVALAVLWRNKAALRGGACSSQRYPEYGEYRERVRGTFVPRPTRLPRIEAADGRDDGALELLDDLEPPAPLDDLLDRVVLVPGREQEARRLGAHALVVVERASSRCVQERSSHSHTNSASSASKRWALSAIRSLTLRKIASVVACRTSSAFIEETTRKEPIRFRACSPSPSSA